jgi:pyruvate dehydrogenase E2 component (dihydrolipoamide acetyltransferase)
MAISVIMPALEMAQETGKLLAWKKKEGEQVAKGEPLLEIETDKAVVEIEAPGDGILAGVTAQVGAVVPVGQTIAWLLKPGEQVPAQTAAAAPSARSVSAADRGAAAPAASVAQASAGGPQISPKARRLAKELGVDFSALRGTGPDGVITAEDIQAAAAAAAAPSAGEPMSQIARLMAERTTQSWTTVPHFFVVREIDATRLVAEHKRRAAAIEQAQGPRVTLTDLLVALVARTLAKHPRINATWTGSAIRLNKDVMISLAIAVPDGVAGTVIPRADALDLAAIAAQRMELTERARANKLRPADITGGTFTISNLGMYQVDSFTAIITPPQAAILAVGGIVDRVVAVEGQPAVRPVLTLTLSSDHRVIDGARAAEFMRDLAAALQDPEKILG